MKLMFHGQPVFGPRGPAGPDGNPIGTVISYMGTKAPEDYLVCDGAVYNIADYSKLAEFFQEQFGSASYFGGDGETTFVVPLTDRSGDMISCIKAASSGPWEDVYSTEETVVGRWIDGRPVYRRVAKTVLPSHGGVNQCFWVIDGGGEWSVFKLYGYLLSKSNDKIYYPCEYFSPYCSAKGQDLSVCVDLNEAYSNYFGQPATIVMEYTKTTDQGVSG